MVTLTLVRMDLATIAELLKPQAGVVARHQVLAADGHGPLSWDQRSWAAVLLHWPAALGGRSAARAHGLQGDGDDADIELVVDHARRVDDPPGVRTRRIRAFEAATLMNLGPPRLRVEHAVLALAAGAATEDATVAVLADACQRRRTTATRLCTALAATLRLPRSRLVAAVLEDLATGACSALERRYLRGVERPHGLPTATRQRHVRSGRTTAFRDVDYVELATVVELDGRLGHEEPTDRWADLDRDLDTAIDQRLTVRLGWHQVLQPCRVAAAVAILLIARGWEGTPIPCGSDCPLNADWGGSPAPGAGDPPLS